MGVSECSDSFNWPGTSLAGPGSYTEEVVTRDVISVGHMSSKPGWLPHLPSVRLAPWQLSHRLRGQRQQPPGSCVEDGMKRNSWHGQAVVCGPCLLSRRVSSVACGNYVSLKCLVDPEKTSWWTLRSLIVLWGRKGDRSSTQTTLRERKKGGIY